LKNDKNGIFSRKKTTRIALSTKGLQYADRVSRKDFRFVSGVDVFVCDRFQAAFISPQIANLLTNDPTLDEFSLTYSDSSSFELICELIVGSSMIVDEKNIEVFESLIEDLGNCELSEMIMTFGESCEPLNISNCISRLNKRLKYPIVIDAECDFIASHFSEFNFDAIRSIDVKTLKDILHSD
jgi:hypothetical protein